MKIFVIAAVIIFFGKLSFAESSADAIQPQKKLLDFPSNPPSQTIPGGFLKNVLRNKFFNIDKTLKETGIRVVACSYKNQQTGRVTNYKVLTYCMTDHFLDSMNYKANVGLTFFWVKDKNQNMIPVRLDWQPTEEGWLGVFKEGYILTKDLILSWLKDSSAEKNPDETGVNEIIPAPFKHNFLGRFKISFPSGTHFTDVFFEKNLFTTLFKLDQASQISIEMNPIQNKNHRVQYQGSVLISKEPVIDAAGDILSIDFKTDLNILSSNNKRDFEVSGQTASDRGSERLLP